MRQPRRISHLASHPQSPLGPPGTAPAARCGPSVIQGRLYGCGRCASIARKPAAPPSRPVVRQVRLHAMCLAKACSGDGLSRLARRRSMLGVTGSEMDPTQLPRYRQLTATLRAAIAAGEYPVGSLLPTENRDFAAFRGIAPHRARRLAHPQRRRSHPAPPPCRHHRDGADGASGIRPAAARVRRDPAVWPRHPPGDRYL